MGGITRWARPYVRDGQTDASEVTGRDWFQHPPHQGPPGETSSYQDPPGETDPHQDHPPDTGVPAHEATPAPFIPGPLRSAEQAPTTEGQPGMSKQEELALVIHEMRRSIPELHGVMIASTDGLAIASDFPEAEAERVAAMAATALGLGKRITDRTGLGGLQETVVRGDHGYLVVYAAGENAVLVMSGPVTSNLGLMRIEARSASRAVSKVLI